MSMRLRAANGPPATVDADVLAVPIYREDAEMPADLAELDGASGGVISQAIAWGEFNPLEHPLALIGGGDLTARWLLLLNAGSRGRGAWRARRLASVATRRLNGRGAASLALWLRDDEDDDAWAAAAAGAVAGHLSSDRRLWPGARHGCHEALGRRGALHRCRVAGGARPRRRDR